MWKEVKKKREGRGTRGRDHWWKCHAVFSAVALCAPRRVVHEARNSGYAKKKKLYLFLTHKHTHTEYKGWMNKTTSAPQCDTLNNRVAEGCWRGVCAPTAPTCVMSRAWHTYWPRKEMEDWLLGASQQPPIFASKNLLQSQERGQHTYRQR